MTISQRLDAAHAARLDARLTQVLATAERTGSHLWVAMVGYLLADPADPALMLDLENLLSYPTVGCYRCEEPYTPRLARRRCPGDPRR